MMAERPEVPGRLVLDVNPRGKKALESALAIGTVSSMSIVMPQAVEQTISAPSSPIREEKRSKGFLKHLTRPKSPIHRRKHSHSDPERTPSPQPSHRPRWLGFKKKNKKEMNGATTPVEGASPSPSGSGSSLEQQCEQHLQSLTISLPPSATSVDQLPGALKKADSGSCIPVIMVSSHSGGEYEEEQLRTSGSSVSFEEMNGGDPLAETGGTAGMIRKLSQSSQKSACSSTLQSVGTSGVGSLLSPSGDESYPNSDLESPMSPLSRTSSFTTEGEGETGGHHSDTDPIDADLHPSLTSPVSDPEMQVTTPTKDCPSDLSPTAGSKKELRGKQKKKKDKVSNLLLILDVWIFVFGVYLC